MVFSCLNGSICVILQRDKQEYRQECSMYREAYQDLKRWKGSESRKPCILLGARQVGKTWLMREFGKREYGNVAYINCDTEPMTKTLFKNDYNLRRLLLGFQAITGETISEGGR